MRLTLTLLLLVLTNIVFGQYTESITSSRPGQAFTPLTPGKNVFQVQTGFNVNGARFDFIEDKVNGLGYSSLFRYGVFDRVEIRTQFGLSRISTKPSDQSIGGFSSFGVGSKFNILNRENGQALGLQGDFFLPIVDEDFQSDNVATTLILAFTQPLNEDLTLSTNFGVFWDGSDNATASGLYVINLGFPIAGAFSSFIEVYGFYGNNFFDVLIDGGIAYGINANTLLDLSAGYGSNDGIDQFFVDFGLSWRTKFGSQ